MRTDPYQTRARELAIAAGVDPDGRIPMDGKLGRTMPAWCCYRQAARDEANAAKAAALSVELPPQDAKYADAPLKIMGEHDEATIQQMRNCMKVGNVVSGVLCADGHLGYAQPVGGVIAYEGQVSISGVGFDIACFSGDTTVYAFDGKHWPIKDLVGKSIVVPASLPDGTVIAAEATGVKTKEDAALVRITLDNGESIRCTPEHRFVLRDGTFVEAATLTHGQSLMPFRLYADPDGYILIRDNKRRVPVNAAWIVANSGLMGKIPYFDGDKTVIHHEDRNRSNNDPANLEFMSKKKHDDFMQRRGETALRNLIEGETREPEKFAANYAAAGERGRDGLIAYNKSDLAKQHAAERARKGAVCPICETKVGATNSLARHMKSAHGDVVADNHKVVSVEPLDEREDVYCLVVPGANTFALSVGVFVHNCGNEAIRLDTRFSDIEANIPTIARDIAKTISFGIGRTNDERVDHELFDDNDAWRESGMEDYRQKAKAQLGTVGSGNHYVDLFRDEDDYVWIGVHFGSRGLGHTTATRYLKLAGGKDGMNVPPAVVNVSDEIGIRYLAGMKLAGRYAYAGREWVCERVRQIVGGQVTHSVHNNHNFANLENGLWVVRKGATPAFPGQQGFVGGSMGDNAVILEGVESDDANVVLNSTIHGAGRLFGRKEAKRRFSRETMDEWLAQLRVTLIGADLDESPMAYRRLPDVLNHHAHTIRVLHWLTPFAVVMAGEGEADPWKD